MDINVKIEAPELATAITNVAVALAALANKPLDVATGKTIETTTEAPADEKKKPADIQKEKIAAEIIALGGTPPEKGSVAKFQTVLDNLKEQEEESEQEESEQEESEQEELSLDEVRTLAHAAIKKDPDNADKGKSALKGALKQVKAESISACSQKQLVKLVPMLEEYVGKSLAEVLAEAE